MAIDKLQMKEAFREAVSQEFSSVPFDEESIAVYFSDEFEKKMQKLIVSEKKTLWHCFNTPLKRVAMIAISFLVLFATACTIPAVRNEILEFIHEIFEDHEVFSATRKEIGAITEIYQITDLPEGYALTLRRDGNGEIRMVYENAQGERLKFTQSYVNGFQLKLDAEKGVRTEEVINGNRVYLYVREEAMVALWTDGKYILMLTYWGMMEKEQFLDIISSVQIVK